LPVKTTICSAVLRPTCLDGILTYPEATLAGAQFFFDILHDDWCKTLKTGDSSKCNCDPNVIPLDGVEGWLQSMRSGKGFGALDLIPSDKPQ
jgi:hypothetical protein